MIVRSALPKSAEKVASACGQSWASQRWTSRRTLQTASASGLSLCTRNHPIGWCPIVITENCRRRPYQSASPSNVYFAKHPKGRLSFQTHPQLSCQYFQGLMSIYFCFRLWRRRGPTALKQQSTAKVAAAFSFLFFKVKL